MILLKNLFSTYKKEYKNIDENLNENFSFISDSNEKDLDINLCNLKKYKYKCIEISKNLRNKSLYTGIIGLTVTIFLAMASTGIALTNSIYNETKERVNNIIEEEIQRNQDKLKELENEDRNLIDGSEDKIRNKDAINELNKSISNQRATAKSIKDDIYKTGIDMQNYGWMFFTIIVITIIIISTFFYRIIKRNHDKASYYETLVIMIDDKIEELKDANWEQAQKVELKVNDKIIIGY